MERLFGLDFQLLQNIQQNPSADKEDVIQAADKNPDSINNQNGSTDD